MIIIGLLGATLFVNSSDWAKDVVGFVNLESSGAGGQETLFQSGNYFIVDQYVKSVPLPRSSMLAEDLFRNGLILGGTDFCVYNKLTNAGLDFAFSDDGYVYHTRRDSVEHIAPGTLQRIGGNTLKLIEHLA